MSAANVEEYIAQSPHSSEQWLSVRPIVKEFVCVEHDGGHAWILLDDFNPAIHTARMVVDQPAIQAKKVEGRPEQTATYRPDIKKRVWFAQDAEHRIMRLLPSPLDASSEPITVPYDEDTLAFRQQKWPDVMLADRRIVEPNVIPAELAAFAQPDETAQETKDRLLQALSNLRSMAVGQIPMTDTEKAMLTTLEGAVAQQWFRT